MSSSYQEETMFHGAEEVPAGHPDNLDYQGWDDEGGQACPHSPHWTHCGICNPGPTIACKVCGTEVSHYRDDEGNHYCGEHPPIEEARVAATRSALDSARRCSARELAVERELEKQLEIEEAKLRARFAHDDRLQKGE